MASNDHQPRVRYQQGEWFGIVRNGTVVFLGPETPHALIDAVWELLASAPEAHEVLHEVTEAFGVSLSRIPPFGIIDSKDGLRVFLRGDLELAVQSPAGGDKLTGRDVTTWTERRIGDATSYTVRIGDGSISPLDSLPITSGVVLLSSLDVGARDSADADAIPAVQPATVPAVVPATPAGQSPASIPVSDETMIGYPETDLGLTIAPGHESSGLETANPETANPDAAELQAVHQESAQQVTAQQESADDVQDESAQELADEPSAGADGEPAAEAALVRGEQEDPAGTPATPAADDSMPASTEDPLVPSLENTTNYDHLWDKTVMRNIEDAAVRLDEESDGHDAPASTASREQPAAPLAAPGDDHTGDEPPHGSAAVGPVTAVPQAPAAALAAAVTQSTGLIDSVPWLRSSPGAPQEPVGQPSAPSVAPAPQIPAGWRSPPQVSANDSVATDSVASDSAANDSVATDSGANTSVDEDSDHDGQTIMKSSLAVGDDAGAGTSNAGTSGTGAASAGVPAGTGPSVLARVCSQGHANPPTYPQCSVCGLAVTGDAVQVPRPRLGRMRISTGDLIDLDQSLIIGRQPSVSRVQGGTMPRLVQVESPGGDISRSHVEVRLEGWHVMLCDLKATNGTVLIREGQAPRRLAQNEMAILLDGDIAELGDDISLRFEEIL